MALPAFYDAAPRILMYDPLAAFLSAADMGLVDYGYADAVRLAGHSCPTVAGAWLMARAALRALYGDAPAERGAIEVTMSAAEDDGTTGVIAQVFTLLTGATVDNGFHGIAGRFDRRWLLAYGRGDPGAIAAFRRRDTAAAVRVSMDLSRVPFAGDIRPLMQRALSAQASDSDRQSFGAMWQDRVRRLLLEHADDETVVRVMRDA